MYEMHRVLWHQHSFFYLLPLEKLFQFSTIPPDDYLATWSYLMLIVQLRMTCRSISDLFNYNIAVFVKP